MFRHIVPIVLVLITLSMSGCYHYTKWEPVTDLKAYYVDPPKQQQPGGYYVVYDVYQGKPRVEMYCVRSSLRQLRKHRPNVQVNYPLSDFPDYTWVEFCTLLDDGRTMVEPVWPKL